MWYDVKNKYQKYVESGNYNGDQLTEIMEGLKEDVEIVVYADPVFDAGQMHEIRLGLGNGISTKSFSDPKFSARQMHELRLCVEDGIQPTEIHSIANTKFSAEQMAEIRECFKERLSISDLRVVMNPKFDPKQMATLRFIAKNALANQQQFKRVANPEYSWDKMKFMVECMKYNIDLSLICDPSYTLEELKFFNICFEHKLDSEDVKGLLCKALGKDRRYMILDAYNNLSDKFAFIGCNPEYSDDQVEEIYFMCGEKQKILYDFKNIWTDLNEEKLLNTLKFTSKKTISRLFSLNKPRQLYLTDADPDKWNVTRNKNWKAKVLKLYKEMERNFMPKK